MSEQENSIEAADLIIDPDPLPSPQAALQLQEALQENQDAEKTLLECTHLGRLPGVAKNYAEAHERATRALRVVRTQARIAEEPITQVERTTVISRG